nr:phosphatase PAP2 family protein [uncultured Pedobacter sp.]
MKKLLTTLILSISTSLLFSQQLTTENQDSKPSPNSSSLSQSYYKLPTKKGLYIPLILTTYGLSSLISSDVRNVNYSIREEILENDPHFKTSFDNYLQYLPAATTFALKFGGEKSAHGMWSSLKIYATSSILLAGTVYALKTVTHEQRPDGSAYNSLPSGHTATAFAAAEFMHQEFKTTVPLISYAGYLAASTTGTLRMLNNRHYFSDVLAGAGIGILTTKAAYWLNEKLFEKPKPKVQFPY